MMYSIKLLTIFILSLFLNFKETNGFVKSLLKSPPLMNKEDTFWTNRPLPDIAIASYRNLSISLSRTLKVPTPSYVQTLTDGVLSVTSFSLLRKGCIMQFDLNDPSKSRTLKGDYLWPNELTVFNDKNNNTVMLVPDGFLMPGQSDGGLYAIPDPNNPESQPIRITTKKEGWFYHKAVYIKLPGGKEGIITARANKPLIGRAQGELVWLSVPTKEELDDSFKRKKSTPWRETVIAKGPDVMFEVLDINPEDTTVEVIAAHFFASKLSVHSIRGTSELDDDSDNNEGEVKVRDIMEIDTEGRPYGLCLTTMTPESNSNSNNNNHEDSNSDMVDIDKIGVRAAVATDVSSPTHLIVSTHECSYDIPSALQMVGAAVRGLYPRLRTGTVGSGLRAGDKEDVESGPASTNTEHGGALFAYRLPDSSQWNGRCAQSGPLPSGGIPVPPPASRTDVEIDDISSSSSSSSNSNSDSVDMNLKDIYAINSNSDNKLENKDSPTMLPWDRQTLFRGFKVRGWGGIFSPGAPGFPYVFRMPHKPQTPPLILLAGDCTGSAYIFSPGSTSQEEYANVVGSGGLPPYELAFEVECGATVGSACVSASADSSGDVDVFIPSYELNQIHVYRLSEKDG